MSAIPRAVPVNGAGRAGRTSWTSRTGRTDVALFGEEVPVGGAGRARGLIGVGLDADVARAEVGNAVAQDVGVVVGPGTVPVDRTGGALLAVEGLGVDVLLAEPTVVRISRVEDDAEELVASKGAEGDDVRRISNC